MDRKLLEILNSELKPAIGCTGPLGVSIAAAHAYDAIGGKIKRITAQIDWSMAAKIDDVGIPGTEYLGVEMAIALGAVCGDPRAGLEVFHAVDPEKEKEARAVAGLVELVPLWGRTDLGTYIDLTIETDQGTGRAVIAGRQDGLICKERNGEQIETHPQERAQDKSSPMLSYRIRDYYAFASSCPLEELELVRQAVAYNTRIADFALEQRLGIGIGRTILEKEDAVSKSKGYAAAGCEGRMSGAPLPVMSCGGKGNVGLAASLPIICQAQSLAVGEEQMLRAITLSYLVAIAIIHRIGKSPSMCSCEVAAALGTAAGSVLLQNGTEEQVEIALQNTIPNVFGIVCDGAKLACALRISSGTGIALEAAELALRGVRLANNQGVLAETADGSIDLLGETALYSMVDSDRELAKKIFDKRRIFPLQTFTERQRQ